jgi:TolB-like protein
MSLFSELRRREVWKTLALYIVGAWVVIQGADLLFPGWCIAEAAIRHVWIAALLGLPLALVFSWQFDISASGLRRTPSGETAARALVGSDYALLAALSALTLAIIVMQGQSVWATRDCGPLDRYADFDPPPNSIAVLPFANLSAEADADWLGTGFADSIIVALGQLPEVLVTSRVSSFDPRLKGLSAREIAVILGVRFILEGSVQRQGNRLRITPQLISATDDSHFWSRKIERDYEDLFQIQDEVAEAAASALQVVFSDDSRQRIDRAGTDNLQAFEAYSRAIENLRVRTTDSVLQAVEQLQRAVELDPEFARAHAMLAYAYLGGNSWMELNSAERWVFAHDAARTALRIAPGLSTALTVLGILDDDVDATGELFREAVANDPNDTIALRAYTWYHFFYKFQTAEAMELAERLIRLDPLDEKHYILLSRQQTYQSMHREALETIIRGKEKIPESVALRDREYECYENLGDYSSMIRVMHETLAIDPKNWINRRIIAQDYFNVGMPEEATRWWEYAIETAPEREQDGLRLMLRTALDVYHQRNDEAVFDSLRRWLAEGLGWGFPGSWYPDNIFIEYGERLGRLDDVLSTYESLEPELFKNPSGRGKSYISPYMVGQALVRAGDRQRGEPLLRRTLESIENAASAGREVRGHVPTLLYLGDADAALEVFRELSTGAKFHRSGLGNRFIMQNSPVWAPIRATPEYTAMLEEFDRNAAEHRQKLNAMDLPLK